MHPLYNRSTRSTLREIERITDAGGSYHRDRDTPRRRIERLLNAGLVTFGRDGLVITTAGRTVLDDWDFLA